MNGNCFWATDSPFAQERHAPRGLHNVATVSRKADSSRGVVTPVLCLSLISIAQPSRLACRLAEVYRVLESGTALQSAGRNCSEIPMGCDPTAQKLCVFVIKCDVFFLRHRPFANARYSQRTT